MSGTGPRRDPNSRAGKIAEFYEANPGECLTWADFMTKFDIQTKSQARDMVKYLRERRGVKLRAVSVVMLGAGDEG